MTIISLYNIKQLVFIIANHSHQVKICVNVDSFCVQSVECSSYCCCDYNKLPGHCIHAQTWRSIREDSASFGEVRIS